MPSSSFCPPPSEQIQRKLDASAQSFLDHLGLPALHPLCRESSDDVAATATSDDLGVGRNNDEANWNNVGAGVFELPNATLLHTSNNNKDAIKNALPEPPSVGSISLLELHDHSYGELLITATTMSAPTLAMGELWLRFFAVFLCPLCLCYMIQREITSRVSSKKENKSTTKISKGVTKEETTVGECNKLTLGIYTIGLASSAVLFTDSLYIYEYGRWFGFSLFMLSSILAVRFALVPSGTDKPSKKSNSSESTARTIFQYTVLLLIITTTIVFLRSDGGIAMDNFFKSLMPSSIKSGQSEESAYNPLEHMPHPGIDLPTISEGLYHSKHNPLISSVVSNWPENSRTYTVANGATPYLVNGDQRTGIPFLVNKVEEQEYVRVWTVNRFDGEYLALDIAFPYSDDNGDDVDQRKFVHNLSKPVYLVLHGLNGGSHEEYVKDLVQRRRAEGSTVVVFIARGMMDTAMVGWNMFHGARTGDVDVAARVVREGLISLAEKQGVEKKRQILVGVGYSMGAIILSNYVARSGEHCGKACVFHILT